MGSRWEVFVGVLLTLIGLTFLIGNVLDVDVEAFCVPVGLILLGTWLLVRLQLAGPDKAIRFRPLGNFRRYGEWQVSDEEIWIGVGDVRLDLTSAEFPAGEPQIRVFAFVGDVVLLVPEGVGVSIASTSFVTDVRVFDQRRNTVLTPIHVTSDDYGTADRKVRLETSFFVGSLRVTRA